LRFALAVHLNPHGATSTGELGLRHSTSQHMQTLQDALALAAGAGWQGWSTSDRLARWLRAGDEDEDW